MMSIECQKAICKVIFIIEFYFASRYIQYGNGDLLHFMEGMTMDAYAEKAVQLFREKVRAFNQKFYDDRDRFAQLNLYDDVVAVLEEENKDVLTTLIALLNDFDVHDTHYWIIVAMRGMAGRGKLSREGCLALLIHTERFAAGNHEEWYKSINALQWASEGADVLIDFAENRLLGQHNIHGWRWLAFFAIGTIPVRRKSLITESLREKLRVEMTRETDGGQKQYFQEVLAVIDKA